MTRATGRLTALKVSRATGKPGMYADDLRMILKRHKAASHPEQINIVCGVTATQHWWPVWVKSVETALCRDGPVNPNDRKCFARSGTSASATSRSFSLALS